MVAVARRVYDAWWLGLGRPLVEAASAGSGADRLSEAEARRDGLRMDLNRATVTDLSILPRIGPSLAERIVDFRFLNGPFDSIDSLSNVRGVGDKTVGILAPHLVAAPEVTGKTGGQGGGL